MKRLTEDGVRQILARCNAVITGSHFVYAKPEGRGDHGDAYVNKDEIYPHTDAVSELCREMALRLEPVMTSEGIDVVVGPEKGGIILSQWLTHWLNDEFPAGSDELGTLSVYAEKKEGGGFELRRGYAEKVAGKKVVVVEDILNTGGSVLEVIAAVRDAGGIVVGVCAIANRGNVTAVQLSVPFLDCLVAVKDLKKYSEEECPICKEGIIPVRTDLGHGRQFLEKKKLVCSPA